MRIRIAPVFVKVQMNNWHRSIESIEKPDVVVQRGSRKIRVANIEAHANAVGFNRTELVQAGKKFIKQLRRVEWSIFDGQLEPRLGQLLQQRLDCLNEFRNTVFVKQVDV